MLKILINVPRRLRQLIRAGYLLAIVVLAVYAFLIYRQLQALRQMPVALPNFAFYVTDIPQKNSEVQAMGTWIASTGAGVAAAVPATVQTSTIQCKRTTMACVESTATVSIKEGGFLESTSFTHEIDQWTDTELVTKPLPEKCAMRIIRMNLTERIVTATVTPPAENSDCKETLRTMTLENGNKLKQAVPAPKK